MAHIHGDPGHECADGADCPSPTVRFLPTSDPPATLPAVPQPPGVGPAAPPPSPPGGGEAPPDHPYSWVGQRFDTCDRCGRPERDHPIEHAHTQPTEGGGDAQQPPDADGPAGAARSDGNPTGTPPAGPTGSLGHADLAAVARTLRDRADWHWPGPPDRYPSPEQWEAFALRVAADACDRLASIHSQATDPDDDRATAWHTTCAACARTLDAAARDHERAERAEAEIERFREVIREQLPHMPYRVERDLRAALEQSEAPQGEVVDG